ncbi:MAG TPA: hypothetical protein VM940_04665 [Chthoniobacterales bacterium]|jgi:hypothetical protein|nr:hypothetical protein [Chthoniobacterales bacterium]
MTSPTEASSQRLRLRGAVALAIVLFDALLLERLLPTFGLDAWVRAASFVAGAALAAWGFPSVFSIIALCLLALWFGHGDLFLSPEFHVLLWVAILAGAGAFHRVRDGAPSLLLVIGSSGFVVIFLLHASSQYTHGLALDGFAWSHWAYEWLAVASAAAILCFPVGVAMLLRGWKGRI